MPFFSVIIPTLNEEQFLPRLLSCLVKQTKKNFEVILVDGHSDDTTVSKAKSYIPQFSHRGIQLTILTSRKRNIATQRNLGVSHGQGTYCVFLDADIQLHENFLEQLFEVVSKKKVDIAGVWAESDSPLLQDRIVALLLSFVQEIPVRLKKPYIIGHCIIARRAIAKKYPFDPAAIPAEDYEFVDRVHKHGGSVAITREPRAIVSLRRYRARGRILTFLHYAKMSSVALLKGPKKIRDYHLDYPTGGHVHDA